MKIYVIVNFPQLQCVVGTSRSSIVNFMEMKLLIIRILLVVPRCPHYTGFSDIIMSTVGSDIPQV